jgi:hypothetical protein
MEKMANFVSLLFYTTSALNYPKKYMVANVKGRRRRRELA